MACCEIYVTKNGVYCCDIKDFRVKPGCFVQIKSANLPVTPLLLEVATGVYAASGTEVGATNCTTVLKPGEYKLDFDCSTIHGQVAPEENPISLCIECICPKNFDSIISMQLQQLVEQSNTCPPATARGVITTW